MILYMIFFQPVKIVDGIKINRVLWHEVFIQYTKSGRYDKRTTIKKYNEATEFFKKWVKDCTENIFLQKIIHDDYNFEPNNILCLLFTSFMLSLKTIVGPDHMYYLDEELVHVLSVYSNCNKNELLRMEKILYITTDYSSCRDIMNKMYEM